MRVQRVARVAVLAAFLGGCGGVRLRSPIAPASGPPASFTPTTSDVRATRLVDIRDGVTKVAAFRAATDLLTQRYSVDVSDQHAGFLMSPWQSSVMREGVPDLRYRTRIVIRFLGDDWKQASVRSEANWQRGEEWEIGFDSTALDAVSNELKGRIGKRP